MRKVQKGQAKTSLKDLLAQHPEPKRNDWTSGRPNAPPGGTQEFSEYDPRAFESSSEDDEAGPGAGGAFAILAGMNGDAEADDGDWVAAVPRNKKRAPGSGAGPSAAPAATVAAAPAARRPAAAPGPASRPGGFSAAPVPRVAGSSGAGSGSAAGRAPYSLAPAGGPGLRSPRPQTHDSEGRPVSDTYYQTFQLVYRNANGAVCMKFHKTDVVTVRLNGDVVVTSGGFRTRTTYCSVAEALEALGLLLHSSGGDGRGDWFVVLADGSRVEWEDGLVLPAASPEERGRGEWLLAAYSGGGRSGAAVDVRRAGPAPAADAAPGRPLPGPTPTSGAAARAPTFIPAPGPAQPAWSYRSASGVSATSSAPGAAGYAPHLRPPPAYGAAAAATTDMPFPVPVPVDEHVHVPRPAARTASELAAMLDEALALHDGGGETLDDEHMCIACMAAQKTTVLLPCGHLVLCGPCAVAVLARSGICPMCRAMVECHVAVSD